jgi:large subunit ribosomal protein L7A
MMLEKIHGSENKVVGIKQTRKAIRENKAELVYLAEDVDGHLFDEIKKACKENNVEICYVKTMKELGKACAIDIKAASAALISEG